MSRVGVVGATGFVGGEMLRLLEERDFPVEELRAFASPRSVGRTLRFGSGQVTVQALEPDAFRGLDLVIVDVDDPISLEWTPVAVSEGATVVDNSSAFRMRPDVPLVIPEINAGALATHQGIVACPNCATATFLVPLAPLHRAARVRRLVVSTYQSVSGAGRAGLIALEEETARFAPDLEKLQRAGAHGGAPDGTQFQRAIAFNVIPAIGRVRSSGYTGEEEKVGDETRKILGDQEIRVSATCVRVPALVGHGVSVNAEFGRPLPVDEAEALLRDAPGVSFRERDDFPTPLDAAGLDACFVGRLRADPSHPNALNFWAVSDNLRKGAALNAVQIAEELLRQGL